MGFGKGLKESPNEKQIAKKPKEKNFVTEGCKDRVPRCFGETPDSQEEGVEKGGNRTGTGPRD